MADPAKNHDNQDIPISFKQSDTDTSTNCVAWIAAHDPNNSDAPRMPKLAAKAGLISGLTYCWKLKVVFHDRHGNPHRDFDTGDPYDSNSDPISQDNVTVPSATTGSRGQGSPDNGWKKITDGSPWNIYDDPDWTAAVNQGFFGGDAVLSLRIEDDKGNVITPQQEYKFRIAGENPDYTKCKNYISSKYGGPAIPTRDTNNPNAWNGFWFAYAVAKQETAGEGSTGYYNHFLTSGGKSSPKPGKEGIPNWNNDGTTADRPTGTGGYGIFQHTYEQGEANYIMPRKWIWNWKENVDGIQAKFTQKLNIENQTYQALRSTYPALGDILNHLNFSGLESLLITFYNGGGGQIKRIPRTHRLTCWWGEGVSAWQFLKNSNNYVDKVNNQLDH